MIESRLKPIRFLKRNKYSKQIWLFECICGNTYEGQLTLVKSGRVKSCGCFRSETTRKIGQERKTHKLTHHRLYNIWCGIKKRCYNKKHIAYSNYGGRGITLCDIWKFDFQEFYDWAIENGYQDDLSIDRIDNDGNYEPSNCRWATDLEQSQHKRTNKLITYNNKTQTYSQWDRELGFPRGKLRKRLTSGWTIEKAIRTP